MRVVADTNVIVSALLWQGSARRVLDAAREGTVELFTSAVLLAELEDVLSRDKFVKRLDAAGLEPHHLVMGYAALASLAKPAAIAPVVYNDPDDDAVLACAVAARAEAVVSGDRHLLGLEVYEEIPVLRVAELLAQLPSRG